MNKKWTALGVVGALAIGIAASPLLGNQSSAFGFTNGLGNQNGMMGNTTFNEDFQGDMMGGSFNPNFQGGMMGGSSYGMMGNSSTMWGGDLDIENTGEFMTDDVLIERVERYISQYDTPLALGDLFKYSDTEYYVSIEDEKTGLGAFELLINPYTGSIRPEPGPNMMWNEETSMMSGMHGTYTKESGEMISQQEAIASANQYLKKEKPSLQVTEEGHQFPGYYTFHVEKDGKPYGMLSVHGTTADVWYHTWHGELIDIKNLHDEKISK